MNLAEFFVTLGVKSENLQELDQFQGKLNKLLSTVKKLAKADAEQDVNLKALSGAQKELKDSIEETVQVSTQAENQSVRSDISFGRLFKTVRQGVRQFRMVVSVIMATIGALIALAVKSAKAAIDLQIMNTTIGVSIQKFQQYRNLAAQAGVATDEFAGAVAGLRRKSADIALGRGDISPFALLGINPHQDPMAIMQQLQDKIKAFPTHIGTALAQDMGFSDKMINFIRTADFSKLGNAKALDQSSIDKLTGFMVTWQIFYTNISVGMSQVAASFVGFLKPVLEVIEGLFTAFKNVVMMVGTLLSSIKSMRSVLVTAMGVALAAISPVTAAIAGLYLVLEDIAVYFMGGKSILGYIMAQSNRIQGLIDSLIPDWIKELWAWIKGKEAKNLLTTDTAEGTAYVSRGNTGMRVNPQTGQKEYYSVQAEGWRELGVMLSNKWDDLKTWFGSSRPQLAGATAGANITINNTFVGIKKADETLPFMEQTVKNGLNQKDINFTEGQSSQSGRKSK